MIPSNYLTATQTQELLRSGQLSESQILSDHVQRYNDRNGEVGAWVHVNHSPEVTEGEEERGKALHGVVVGIKDILSEYHPLWLLISSCFLLCFWSSFASP